MKQFILPLCEPLGALWFLMVVSVSWLFFRRQWRTGAWLAGPTLVLFVLGSTPLAEALVAAAERPYATGSSVERLAEQAPEGVTVVVTLGGGHSYSEHDPLRFSVGEAGDRFLVGLHLIQTGKAQVLVLGGSGATSAGSRVPEAEVVQSWLRSFGPHDSGLVITNLGICGNTHDEALAFKLLAGSHGWTNTILVTSALHMARSVAVFKKQGIAVTPLACDFQIYGVQRSPGISPFPRQDRLRLLANYLHEKIGWWVYRWKGWV
jgi:uncharacterized SAM-binding protein YcdF (DUF218 family)